MNNLILQIRLLFNEVKRSRQAILRTASNSSIPRPTWSGYKIRVINIFWTTPRMLIMLSRSTQRYWYKKIWVSDSGLGVQPRVQPWPTCEQSVTSHDQKYFLHFTVTLSLARWLGVSDDRSIGSSQSLLRETAGIYQTVPAYHRVCTWHNASLPPRPLCSDSVGEIVHQPTEWTDKYLLQVSLFLNSKF